jgi:hypothetical protein
VDTVYNDCAAPFFLPVSRPRVFRAALPARAKQKGQVSGVTPGPKKIFGGNLGVTSAADGRADSRPPGGRSAGCFDQDFAQKSPSQPQAFGPRCRDLRHRLRRTFNRRTSG